MPDSFPVNDPARIAQENAAAAEVAPFERVLTRARTNRRRRHATLAVGALTAVGLLAGVVTTEPFLPHIRGPVDRPPATHHHAHHAPGPTRPQGSGLSRRIVTDPRAGLLDFAVSPSDPAVRAVTKGGVLWPASTPTLWASAISTDGFETARYVHLGGPGDQLIPLPGNRFYLGSGPFGPHATAWVVSTTGARTPVRFSHDTRPASPGDVLVGCGDWQYCALDPDHATAHWFPGPTPSPGRDPGLGNGLFTLVQNGSIIWGYEGNVQDEIVKDPRVWWTTDGGATWSSHQVSGVGGGLALTTPTQGPARDDLVLAYATGSGSPYAGRKRPRTTRLLASTDAGAHWRTLRLTGHGDITDGAVLPDGRLLLVTTQGLLRSTGTGWTHWTDLTDGWPPVGRDGEHLCMTVDRTGVTLFSTRESWPARRSTVWTSADAGTSWTLTRMPG